MRGLGFEDDLADAFAGVVKDVFDFLEFVGVEVLGVGEDEPGEFSEAFLEVGQGAPAGLFLLDFNAVGGLLVFGEVALSFGGEAVDFLVVLFGAGDVALVFEHLEGGVDDALADGVVVGIFDGFHEGVAVHGAVLEHEEDDEFEAAAFASSGLEYVVVHHLAPAHAFHAREVSVGVGSGVVVHGIISFIYV